MSDTGDIPGTGTGTTPKGGDLGEPSSGELDVLSDSGGEEEPQGLEEGLVIDDEDESDEIDDSGGDEGSSEVGGGKEGESGDEGEEVIGEGEEEEEEGLLEEEEEEEEEEEDLKEEGLSAWQKLKSEYPKLAKDREFKQIFFGYRAYNDLFPGGYQQAKEINEKANFFDTLDIELGKGDPTVAFKEMSKESLEKLSKNFLPALYKFDRTHFAAATRPLVIDILNNIHDYSVAKKDDNLRKSVRNISNYLLGTPDVPRRGVSLEENPEVKAEKEKLAEERKQDFLRDRRKFLSSTDSRVGSRLTKVVEDNIDPKDEFKLTPFTKNAIAEKVIRDIKTRLESNEGLIRRMESLHEQAVRNNFSDDISKKLVAAYLGPAKRLIPALIIKHRNAALGKTTAKGGSRSKVVSRSGKIITSREGGGTVTTGRTIDMSRTSPEDFLAGKVVYREK